MKSFSIRPHGPNQGGDFRYFRRLYQDEFLTQNSPHRLPQPP